MIPGIKKRPGRDLVGRLEKMLAAAGCRATRPRRAVLEQIASQGSSFTAGSLLESVNRAAPLVGRATVFRTLDLLVDLGALQRVHTEPHGTWGHSYSLCDLSGEHHHHLVCTGCGRIADLPGCVLDSMVEEMSAMTSFRIEGHHLELYGRCLECQQKSE